jgi:hypothetical protein
MQVEQRYVIKFVVEEGMKGVEIIDRLNKHHGRDALQQTQMYYWTIEVKCGTVQWRPTGSLCQCPQKSEMSALISLNKESTLRRAAGMWCYATDVVQKHLRERCENLCREHGM